MRLYKKGRYMKNVYVVTRGEYSGYHIVAVFEKKEDADKFVAVRNDIYSYDKDQVEEYELNALAKYTYLIECHLRDGEEPDFYAIEATEQAFESAPPSWLGSTRYWSARGRNKEEALKNASDFRAKWKAEQEGLV